VAITFASWTCFPLHSASTSTLQPVRHPGVLGQERGPLADSPHVAHRVCRFQAEAVLLGGLGDDGEILAQDLTAGAERRVTGRPPSVRTPRSYYFP
jgi:hypothetical protein